MVKEVVVDKSTTCKDVPPQTLWKTRVDFQKVIKEYSSMPHLYQNSLPDK